MNHLAYDEKQEAMSIYKLEAKAMTLHSSSMTQTVRPPKKRHIYSSPNQFLSPSLPPPIDTSVCTRNHLHYLRRSSFKIFEACYITLQIKILSRVFLPLFHAAVLIQDCSAIYIFIVNIIIFYRLLPIFKGHFKK